MRGGNAGAGVAVKGHQLFERTVSDDDAGSVGGGVSIKPFEFQCDVEQGFDSRVTVPFLLQARLQFYRLFQGDGRCRIHRDHFRQAIHLAVGQLQHAAHITRDHAGLQFAEGDDLRHALAAITLLHIVDHFVATVLTEVDVEVRHGHTVGIEEAFEQQVEAQRIKIGDHRRVSHE